MRQPVDNAALLRALELYLKPDATWQEVSQQLRQEGYGYHINTIRNKLYESPAFRLPAGVARCCSCKRLYFSLRRRSLCDECKREGKKVSRWRGQAFTEKSNPLSDYWLRQLL